MRVFILLMVVFITTGYCIDRVIPYQLPANSSLKIKVKEPFFIEKSKKSIAPIPDLNKIVPIPKLLTLEGVVKIDDRLVAIVNGNLYKVGDKLDNGIVSEIGLNYLVIDRNGKKDKITMNNSNI
ncbi:MAG: hypothetical protein K6348_02555 [Deferribacterales bacterium]